MDKIDWLGKPYYSLNAYFKHVYGQKIYKIAVDAGLTCPNRDGSLDNRGCIFCSAGGSGDFAVSSAKGCFPKDGYMSDEPENSVKAQIKSGLAKFNKSVGDKFVIYFQAFTNTYGDIDYLRKIWSEALEEENVVGISIATRPDCLSETVLSLLKELQEKYCGASLPQNIRKFIWIELGLQTIHETTEKYIRRHYPLSVYDKAVKDLGKLKIPYITHIILGLPHETQEMMIETVRYVNNHSVKPFGIKLQLLHVLKNTDLAKDYEAGKFKTMNMENYIDTVIKCLKNISPDVVIHRVTGDGPKNILISPTWSGNKKLVLNSLHKKMKELNVRQGL